MRLTFLVGDDLDYRGGPIVNMSRLLPALRNRGFQIRVFGIVYRGCPTLERLRDESAIPFQAIPRRVVYSEDRVRWILRQLADEPPDVFVANHFVVGCLAASWVRRAGIPTIGYLRSCDPFYAAYLQQFAGGDRRWALSGLACVSRSLQVYVDKLAPPWTQTCLMPSGVPVPTSMADQQQAGFGVCYVGRFEQTAKRFRETAEAILRNVETSVCSHAGFIGTGSLGDWLDSEITKRHLADRVCLHGVVEPDQLHSVMSRYHALTLLSDYEGMPGAVMDAMAAGLVPVTTDISGGVSELVQHGRHRIEMW